MRDFSCACLWLPAGGAELLFVFNRRAGHGAQLFQRAKQILTFYEGVIELGLTKPLSVMTD